MDDDITVTVDLVPIAAEQHDASISIDEIGASIRRASIDRGVRITTQSVSDLLLHLFGIQADVSVDPRDPTAFIVTLAHTSSYVEFTIAIDVDESDANE